MGLFSRKKPEPVQVPTPEPVQEPSFHLKLNELDIELISGQEIILSSTPVNLETFEKQPISLDDELKGVINHYSKDKYNDFFDRCFYYQYDKPREENSYSIFHFFIFKTYTEENEREIVKLINQFYQVFGKDDLNYKGEFDTEDLKQLRSDENDLSRLWRQVVVKEDMGSSLGIMKRTNQIAVSSGDGSVIISISSPVLFEKN